MTWNSPYTQPDLRIDLAIFERLFFSYVPWRNGHGELVQKKRGGKWLRSSYGNAWLLLTLPKARGRATTLLLAPALQPRRKTGDVSPLLLFMAAFLYLFFGHHFYFPAQLVGGFTLSDLLDNLWSQVSSLLPPVRAFNIYSSEASF